MKLLHDHHNYKRADFAFITMIVVSILYSVGFFILDVTSLWISPLFNITVSSWLFASIIVIFGIIDLLIAVTLLSGHKELPEQFKIFAIIF